MNDNRIQQLQQHLVANGLSGMALMPGPNMIYLSNIHTHMSERPVLFLVPAAGAPAVIIPTLEAMKAQAAGVPTQRIFDWDDVGGFAGAFDSAAAALDMSTWTLGVEGLHMRVLEREQLQASAPGLQVRQADDVMSSLRRIKDDIEVAAMEQAVAVAEQALEALLPRIALGMSEKQIAALLTQELLARGGESIAFGPIVSAGPNGASPHAVPTDRPIQQGDLLVIDWGVYVDGYPSDITRTFAVGEIDPELQRIHEIVREANAQGKLAARPGVTGEEVDRAARAVIEAAGYGEYFFHRTGHGLGLEIHEEPNMVQGNTTPLEPGNVFTIEPGIYLAGRGGVRIEDNVLVTSDGHRSLTTFPRELMTVAGSA
jgi:Xaa-Pro aminopeptidase